MRGYVAFIKKEWMEAIRTYRVFLMGAVFLLLGILNPLTAKLLPVLFENITTEGMTITIQSVGAKDSWQQFYKNVPQMGLLVLVILFSSMLASEFSKGTLIPILAKGLKRNTVVLAKYTVSAAIWTVAYVGCAAISWGYTVYFWPKDEMHHIVSSLAMVWLFGMFLLAVMLLAGVLTRKMAGTLLTAGGVFAVLALIGIAPKAARYNPMSLISNNMELLMGTYGPGRYMPAVLLTVIATIVCLMGACRQMNRAAI